MVLSCFLEHTSSKSKPLVSKYYNSLSFWTCMMRRLSTIAIVNLRRINVMGGIWIEAPHFVLIYSLAMLTSILVRYSTFVLWVHNTLKYDIVSRSTIICNVVWTSYEKQGFWGVHFYRRIIIMIEKSLTTIAWFALYS